MGSFALIRDENSIVYPDMAGGTTTDYVWSVNSDAQLRSFAVSGTPYLFKASEDGATVISTSNNTKYDFYDTKTGQLSGSITPGSYAREGSYAVTKNLFCVADLVDSAAIIRVYKIASGVSSIKLLPPSSSPYVSSLTASRDETTIAVASSSLIRIWKTQ
jgi:hypothetical protein